MNKIIPISMIGILVLSGFGIVVGINTNIPLLDPPYGPTEGYTGIEYTFYFVIPVDPNGDEYFTQWNWSDGDITDWLGPYASGQTTSASHIWTDAGVYEIRVKLKNINGTESNWSEPHIITIIESGPPPEKPIIDGPSWGIINHNYTFCVTWTDPDASNFYFMWNWGDGNISDWLGPYASGQTICSNHSWSQKGTYAIQVKLKDEDGVEIYSDFHIFNVYESSRTFIFGRFTNLTEEDGYTTFEAVNLWLIFFNPFQFIHYINREVVALDNNSPGGYVVMHSLKFIIGFNSVVIYN
jgi:hypothetical protein